MLIPQLVLTFILIAILVLLADGRLDKYPLGEFAAATLVLGLLGIGCFVTSGLLLGVY